MANQKARKNLPIRLLFLIIALVALTAALTLGAAAADAHKYDYEKPALAEGEFAVNANGTWVTFDAAKPYAETVTNEETGKATSTYYVPVQPVADVLGATVDGADVSYAGVTATFETFEKDGAAYATLTSWADAFAEKPGAKTMTDGSYLYVALKDDVDMELEVAGKAYTFVSKNYDGEVSDIPYREVKVNQELDGQSVLFISLHGNSYRGIDNIMQLKMAPHRTLCQYFTENGIKGVAIVPQCSVITDPLGWCLITDDMAKWIEEYVAENDIDPDKVYVVGGSMGAYGTWNLIGNYGELFAAAMPISGNPRNRFCTITPEAVTVPVYQAIGSLESETTIADMQLWYDEYTALGGTTEFAVVPDYDHPTSCEYSMNFERIDWLLSFDRGEGVRPAPTCLVYDYEIPELAEGEVAVQANGAWVDFGSGPKPYAETVTNEETGRATSTYYVPFEPVAKALGAELDGSKVTYAGYTAEAELIDGVYVPLTFWADAFAEIGAKTTADATALYISLKTDADYVINYDGVSYTYKSVTYTNAEGQPVLVRETEINSDLEGQSALVLYLHGNSYRGNDNATQLKLTPLRTIGDYLSDNGIKAVLAAPQLIVTETGSMWSDYTAPLGEWLRDYIANNDIDPDRVYIMGGSMGGGGTWGMLRDHGDLFASAFIVAADPTQRFADPVDIEDILPRGVPIYTTIGENDSEKSITLLNEWLDAYRAAGGYAEYELLPVYGHIEACEYAYTPEVLDWVFSFTRDDVSPVEIVPQPAPSDEPAVSPQTGAFIAAIALLGAAAVPVTIVARKKSK